MAASGTTVIRPKVAPLDNAEGAESREPTTGESGTPHSPLAKKAANSGRRLSIYAPHFHLTGEPFALTPDPSFLYLSPGHAEALAALKVGLQDRRGLLVMTGEVGTGKTTLLYSLLSELSPEIKTAYISNTKLAIDDILRQALADFGVPNTSRDKLALLEALNIFLSDCAAGGKTAALIVDEAQNLSDDAFEDIRLLSNFETFSTKLLQIVLVGQPELHARLAKPSVRQVVERVAVRCEIAPLSRDEGRRYIEHRLDCAGGSIAMFTPEAVRMVLRHAGGLPRRINIICHNAMLFAYGRGISRVTHHEVRTAAREREAGAQPATASRRQPTARSPLRAVLTGAAGLLIAGTIAAAAWWNIAPKHSPVTAPTHLSLDNRLAPPGTGNSSAAPARAFGTALDVDTGYTTDLRSRTSHE